MADGLRKVLFSDWLNGKCSIFNRQYKELSYPIDRSRDLGLERHEKLCKNSLRNFNKKYRKFSSDLGSKGMSVSILTERRS